MDFRKAKIEDLPQLKSVYEKTIKKTQAFSLTYWDDEYPNEYFAEDISLDRLYVLTDCGIIVSAFALADCADGEKYIKWEKSDAKALYLQRLAVNSDYLRRGIAGIMLKKAATVAKENNADYLRLFVISKNIPAINLYIKNGFGKAGGSFDEKIDDDLILHESAFEIAL